MKKNTGKRVLFSIIYTLDIVLTVLCIILPMFLMVKEFMSGSIMEGKLTQNTIFAIIMLVALPFLHYVRILMRRTIDFDEFGNSLKYKDYDHLSRAEKDVIDKARLEEMERILDSNTLRKMTHTGSKKPEEDLQALIGMDNVKDEILKMAARMEYEGKSRKKRQEESMHMCFLGAPGTGKTTCARIMAGFLYKYHYITKNQFIECDGLLLRSNTANETRLKVTRLIQAAMGGILFIDEAYTLAGYEDSVAALIKYMEDYRGSLVVILAGYRREMQLFIDMNSGIFSRIKYYMLFENYSNDELYKIFCVMAENNGFSVDDNCKINFCVRMNLEKENEYFGNARTVRNVLERSIDNHYLNLKKGLLEKSEKNVLHEIDISKQPEFRPQQDMF